MAMLNINLLEKQQTHVSRFRQAKYAVAAVTGAIVALQLLMVVFFYTTLVLRKTEKGRIIEQTTSLKDEITKLDQAENDLYPGLTLSQQSRAFRDQVASSRQLIDNHKYFSLYLSEIASNTPNTIKLTSFATNSQNNLVLQGTAKTYTDVSRLAESFKKLSFAKNTNIQEAKLGSTATGQRATADFPIAFNLIIEMKSAAELGKLPKPTGKSTPRPRPSATPTPSASPQPGRPF